METPKARLWCFTVMLTGLSAPAHASVSIKSITPSLKSPQKVGTSITWTAKATDTGAGPLTFQFNVAPPGQGFALVKDFNVGMLSAGTWTGQPFVWVPTGIEGTYQIQVVIKDFTSNQTGSQTATFTVNPLVTGSTPVVVKTANSLVALFSAPSCAAGSSMRVSFQEQSKAKPATTTSYQDCHPPATMTFEIAGMYPSTTYSMFSETNTGGTITNGPTVAFTTGALPTHRFSVPKFTVKIPAGSQTDTTDSVILQNISSFSGNTSYPNVATDLSGNIIWYYNPGQAIFLTRPLSNGTFLTLESGASWNPDTTILQVLRQIDLAGNIIKETNLGVLGQELLALGATDAQMCSNITNPVVGSACLNTFHHDAIQTLPNGYTAVFVAVEKVYPAGTQGDTTGLPVDVLGDMIVVLNQNWQAVWYFDSFEHASGGTQLNINRPPVLGETCHLSTSTGCPPIFLATSGIAPGVPDWLHGNSLYYWPQTKDIIWSSRHQDWVMMIDYNNGAGTGNILWRLGPCGDFTFNNTANDPWPWNSHQHEFGIQNNGTGPATLFDNGNTRWSKPGASTGCMQGVGKGDSRGMALTIDEATLQVTPVLSDDLGVQGFADGSAQLLSNGSYAFVAPNVSLTHTTTLVSYILEILPTAGTLTGTQVLNIEAPVEYRIWRMPNMYEPPIT